MQAQRVVMGASIVAAAVSLLAGTVKAEPTGRPSAAATFTGQDGRGCVLTEVSVFVRRGNAGQNVNGKSRLRLFISQVDECQDLPARLNVDTRVDLTDGQFRVDPDLATASLEASVPLIDRQSHKALNGTATIRLKWTAVEEALATDVTFEPEEPGRFIRLIAPARRTLRMASVSGMVDAGLGNLTPGSADTAWISLAVGGRPTPPPKREK